MNYCSKIFLVVAAVVLLSCNENSDDQVSTVDVFNFSDRENFHPLKDSLMFGETYLSVYSQIYSRSEKNLRNLTATVSIRNTAQNDTLVLNRIDYFGSAGNLVKSYTDNPIYVLPLETIEIIISEDEVGGGTGGNFIFNWSVSSNASKPLFECVMISTAGQQGISFVTTGVDI